MTQLPLNLTPSHLHDIPRNPKFLGPGYEPEKDKARLSRHCLAVLAVLRAVDRTGRDRWWTYADLAKAAGVPEGSCRSRVANLRAWGHSIEWRVRPDRFREVKLNQERG